MSDNEDFILDENSLREIDETEELYFSQIQSTPVDTNTTRKRKLNNEDTNSSSSSRKNRILDLFSSNEPDTQFDSSGPGTTSKKSFNSQCRKHMALEIIAKASLITSPEKDKTPAQVSQFSRPVRPLLDTDNIIEPPKSNSRQSIWPNRSTPTSPDVFKTPASVGIRQNARNNVEKPRMTLVRRFPGPAGLRPDPLDGTAVDVAILLATNQYENDENENPNGEISRVSDFCSQETTRLFSGGAWRRMLDDLPRNFLQNHDIASLNQNENPQKVPLLAAMIHRINFDTEYPVIVLKDICDTIEAIVEKSICATHPNILQRGYVWLLRDALIFHVQDGKKLYPTPVLMICYESIMGVYSEDARIVTTPALDEISSISRSERHETQNNSTPDRRTRVGTSEIEEIPSDDVEDGESRNIEEVPSNEFDRVSQSWNIDEIEDSPREESEQIENQTDVDNAGPSDSIEDVVSTITNNEIEENSRNKPMNGVKPSTQDTEPVSILTQTPRVYSGFGSGLFSDDEDEIMSQIDLDSIASAHGTK